MINIDTIEQEILDLERRDTTYATIERLSWLYTVRDHLKAPKQDAKTGYISGNEFCEACSDVPMQSLMEILSEHMECIQILYPKEYCAIIQKINDLKV